MKTHSSSVSKSRGGRKRTSEKNAVKNKTLRKPIADMVNDKIGKQRKEEV